MGSWQNSLVSEGMLTNVFQWLSEKRDCITDSVTGGQNQKDQVEHLLILYALSILMFLLSHHPNREE